MRFANAEHCWDSSCKRIPKAVVSYQLFLQLFANYSVTDRRWIILFKKQKLSCSIKKKTLQVGRRFYCDRLSNITSKWKLFSWGVRESCTAQILNRHASQFGCQFSNYSALRSLTSGILKLIDSILLVIGGITLRLNSSLWYRLISRFLCRNVQK